MPAIVPIISDLSKQKTVVNRKEMAGILGWSLSKLDRRTSEKAIPSMLDGDRRMYEVSAVLAAIKEGTAKAEEQASQRQAARQQAKRKD